MRRGIKTDFLMTWPIHSLIKSPITSDLGLPCLPRNLSVPKLNIIRVRNREKIYEGQTTGLWHSIVASLQMNLIVLLAYKDKLAIFTLALFVNNTLN